MVIKTVIRREGLEKMVMALSWLLLIFIFPNSPIKIDKATTIRKVKTLRQHL